MRKTYLGDSVYCELNDCRQIVLTTENGLLDDPSNIIILEMEVYQHLKKYIEALLPVKLTTLESNAIQRIETLEQALEQAKEALEQADEALQGENNWHYTTPLGIKISESVKSISLLQIEEESK